MGKLLQSFFNREGGNYLQGRRISWALLFCLSLIVASAAEGIAVGDKVKVKAGTGTLNARDNPGTSGTNVIGSVSDGATGVVTDGPRTASSYTWYKVSWDGRSLNGWSVADYLQVVVNQPPTHGLANQYRQDTGAAIAIGGTMPSGVGVTFKVTGTDPEGDTYKLEVELRKLPASFTGTATHSSSLVASGTQAATSAATGLAAGNYGWKYRVVDSRGAASSWSSAGNPDFIVQDVNQPPTHGLANQYRQDTGAAIAIGGTMPSGVGVTFKVTGTDPEGDTYKLEVELRKLPASFTGTATHSSSLVASGTQAATSAATGLAAGNYGWKYRVVDSRGAASSWSSAGNPDFIVQDVNQPPTHGLANQYRQDTGAAIAIGGTMPSGVPVTFKVTGTDPEGDTYKLEVELRKLPASFTGTATHSSSLVASGTQAATSAATGLAAGNYGWKYRVVDSRGATSSWSSAGNPDFIVQAQLTQVPTITFVSPDLITADANNAPQTLTVYGTNFVNKPSVTLTWTGEIGYTVPSSQVTFVSNTQLTMSIRLGAVADSWTVKVTNPDGKDSNTEGFEVLSPNWGSIPISDGFQYPIGDRTKYTQSNDGDGWFNALEFGEYYSTYGKYHLGEDWNAETGGNTDLGLPVYAVSNGMIVYANSVSGWGNVLIVRHKLADGTLVESLYGHLQSFSKTSGAITRGEQVGAIGDGGGAYYAHLHLEVRDANCLSWGAPGPGYSVTQRPSGWTDPSDFIDTHPVSTSGNPAPSDVATQIRILAQQYQIPAIIIAGVMSKESPGWKQFDGSGNPLVGSTGDVGIMQINVTNPPFTFDHERVKTDWVYNLKIGCEILKHKFGKYAFDTLSPYDSAFDTQPDLIENWYYPVAWYNGEGAAAYAYVSSVWQYLGNLPAPGNSLFANISSVGNPQLLSGFPTTIYPSVPYPGQHDDSWFLAATPQQLLSGGFYTLLFEAQASQRIHRWDWNSSSAVDVTDEVLGQTPSGVTLSLAPRWNTVSFPVLPRGSGGTSRFSDIFSDVPSNVLFPYVFYLNTEGFLEYKAFTDATFLAEAKTGYFLYAYQGFTKRVSGDTVLDKSVVLHNMGANAIGVTTAVTPIANSHVESTAYVFAGSTIVPTQLFTETLLPGLGYLVWTDAAPITLVLNSKSQTPQIVGKGSALGNAETPTSSASAQVAKALGSLSGQISVHQDASAGSSIPQDQTVMFGITPTATDDLDANDARFMLSLPGELTVYFVEANNLRLITDFKQDRDSIVWPLTVFSQSLFPGESPNLNPVTISWSLPSVGSQADGAKFELQNGDGTVLVPDMRQISSISFTPTAAATKAQYVVRATARAAAERYSLTLTRDPVAGGTVTIDPAPGQDGKYPASTVVTLQASANQGYSFTGWSGAASGTTNPVQVTTGSDKSVTAHFSVLPTPTRVISLSGDLTFGSVAVGSSAQRTLTVSNTGNSTLTVSSISYPPGFSGNWSGSVASGSSQNVAVTFSPTSVSSYGGTVTVNSDKTSGTDTITASGNGVQTPTRVIALSGDLTFGSVAVGSSAQRTLAVSNTGNSTLAVSGISYPPGFSGNWSGSIASGSSQNVTVTFAPTTASSYSGTVAVNCDYTGGTNTKPVSGAGTMAALPNLTPYRPSGWSDKIVVSNTTGTTSDRSPLYTTDMICVDWAVTNNGTVQTATRFHTSLSVDGVEKESWYIDPPLNAGGYAQVLDFSIGSLSAGTHTITVRVDSTSAISESDEGDNEYTKTITINQSSAPSNDNFSGRIAVGANGGVMTATNTNATQELGEPNHANMIGGKTVWWTWTPIASGNAQVDTIGSGFDTLLGVYTGNSISSLATVASDDDGGGNRTSKTTFTAIAGTTYQIVVDGFSGASGSITLHVIAPVSTPSLSVTPELREVGSVAGSTVFTVKNVGAGILAWSASESLEWLNVANPASGSLLAGQSATVTVNYTGNGTVARSGNVTFTATGATASPKVVVVHQAGNSDDGGGCAKSRMVITKLREEMKPLLTEKIREDVLPLSVASKADATVSPTAPLALRLTANAAIDPASAWAAVEGAGYAANGGVWRATDPADGRDGWIIFTPTAPMPVGTVVTITVGASTVLGDVVASAPEQFLVAESQATEPVSGVTVDEVTGIEPFPEIVAEPASSAYRVGPMGVFVAPATVQIPVPSGVDPAKLEVYYCSEADGTHGWYLGANVVGWMVPDSQEIISDNGQTYIQFEVNHSGVVQLGRAVKTQLGSVGGVGACGTGSSLNWDALLYGLFMLSLASSCVRRNRRSRD